MSTLRVSNIEAKADASSPTIDEKVKVTSSQGRVLVQIDGKTAGITSIGINTTSTSFTIDANQNVQFVGVITAANVNTTGISTFTSLNVTGQSTLTNVNVSGVSTFTTGPVIIGAATSTGTASQPLQVTGGAYVSGNLGVGTTNPQAPLHVVGSGTTALLVSGNARITGILTVGTASVTIDGSQDFPTIRPTLDLNFAATKTLDRRITFTRDSIGTYTDEFGIVKYASNNVPRFDHDPETGESLGLLIEESRTNLVTTSEDFSSFEPNYVNARSTIASTTELAPDGTYTTTRLVRTSGQGQGEVSVIKSGISGVTCGNVYTSSIFVKYLSGSNSSVVSFNNVDSNTVESDSEFNLFTGAIVTDGSQHTTSIIPYPNGWYRLILTRTASTNGAYFWIRSYAQNEGEGFLLWGAQIEAGSFPTSYIPTSGSTVTRAADNAKITGTNFTDFYNSSEGTLFIHANRSETTSDMGVTINNMSSVSDNRIELRLTGSNTSTTRYVINSGGTGYMDQSNPITDVNKYSFAFAQNNAMPCANGTLGTLDTIVEMPVGVNQMTIGSTPAFSGESTTRIRKLSYYPKRLPNAQLQSLTRQ